MPDSSSPAIYYIPSSLSPYSRISQKLEDAQLMYQSPEGLHLPYLQPHSQRYAVIVEMDEQRIRKLLKRPFISLVNRFNNLLADGADCFFIVPPSLEILPAMRDMASQRMGALNHYILTLDDVDALIAFLQGEITVEFHSDIPSDTVVATLTAFANYYRSCGGVGLPADFQSQKASILEDVNA